MIWKNPWQKKRRKNPVFLYRRKGVYFWMINFGLLFLLPTLTPVTDVICKLQLIRLLAIIWHKIHNKFSTFSVCIWWDTVFRFLKTNLCNVFCSVRSHINRRFVISKTQRKISLIIVASAYSLYNIHLLPVSDVNEQTERNRQASKPKVRSVYLLYCCCYRCS